jgi:acyl-CoA thioesterase
MSTMNSVWDTLQLVADGAIKHRFTAVIDDRWRVQAIPQGGIVAALAIEAMTRVLDAPAMTLRTATTLFVAPVLAGAVEIDVTLIRAGRSMAHASAVVKSVGSANGVVTTAAFGAQRPGFDFTELAPPAVPSPDESPSFRGPYPNGWTFDGPPSPFWNEVLHGRLAIGTPPWEPAQLGQAETASWNRFDDELVDEDGALSTAALVVLCDTMPAAIERKVGEGQWFAPSVDLTVHRFGPIRPGWTLTHNRCRWAGDGYASADVAVWDMTNPSLPVLAAYATQVMVFSFAG